MQRIFDPLFTTKVTGRGLGLASLFNAVQRHDGAIQVQIAVGKGTVFRIYFPAEYQEVPVVEVNSSVSNEEWRAYGTALVADDEDAILGIITALLERIGFRVVTASDGHQTVDVYNECAEDISLLLLDVNMPRQNGLEAAMRIRHLDPKVPVLFMSGYPKEQIMKRFGSPPRTGFVTKPFQTDDLTATIRQVMEEGRF